MGERTIKDLRDMQALPLSLKIKMTKRRIRDWINEYGEDVSPKDFFDLVEEKQTDPFDDNICNFSDARNENGYRFTETDFW